MLNKARSYLPVLLVVALLFSQHAHGRPYRRKRTSDQRLAEIQTYLALSKMKGEIKNVPVAFGIVDLNHIGRRRRSLKHSLKELMNSSRQESIADDVLANDPNENLNDLLTRLDQDNRAEWQYDWDIYPSNNVDAPRRYAWPDTELSSLFRWLDTCSILAVGRLGRVAQPVRYFFGERRSVIEFVPCVGIPRAGPPGWNLRDPNIYTEIPLTHKSV
uniref:Uncharacterized protein n=1 Tax=Timema douglasi TaxID=61478 RepID=A0A7R8VHB6_TIMDO|nr:unnamed protein product [Timema douglasi]